MKRLYRSKENRVIAGVLGGLGEYTDTDPVLWRLGFITLLVLTGILPFVLIYIIAALIIPESPIARVVNEETA